MKFLQRYRWVIFAIAAVALIVGWQVAVHSTKTTSPIAGSLGPTPGPDSKGHIAAQRSYLAKVTASDPQKDAAALVSLARFLRPSEASALVASGKLSAVFVAFPESDPEALKITTSVADAVAARAQELQGVVRGEITGLENEAKSATGSRKKEVEALLAKRRQGLDAMKGDCSCVYALVVEHANLSALGLLQKHPAVRLVDVPDPVVGSLEGWKLTPVLPAARSG